ncbi:translocator protein-like [Melia azedarach]|uniref:Translocator protein-like n=1 Tax=Melia azedarach TaxID=155640 RepID=A0ACC1YWU5_MELAZ|nr:translocator protein-like [Melia azedarach]
MATENLKQRVRDDHHDFDTANVDKNDDRPGRQDKKTMAKRGLRSLSIAVALPLSLTLLDIYFFGSSDRYAKQEKSFWFPSLLVLHTACVASTFLMSLSAWLVWAEGGFHKNPTALYLYLAQMGLSLAWDPIVFHLEAHWVGLVLSLATVGALVGCSRVFKEVNPTASDMVKPCLARAALLTLVNLKLVYS